jgi:hypothetical protein
VPWRQTLPETDELVQFKILRITVWSRTFRGSAERRRDRFGPQHVSLVGLCTPVGAWHGASHCADRSDAGRVLIQLLADKQAQPNRSFVCWHSTTRPKT